MVRSLREVAVEHAHELIDALLFRVSERFGRHALRVGDAVERPFVGQLRDGVQGGEQPRLFRTVARIRARRERRPCLPAVGHGARVLAVNDVRGDREDRGRRLGVAVGVAGANLLDEGLQKPARDVVGSVVVVAVAREVALDLVVDDVAALAVDGTHARILDGGERIDDVREARDARREGAAHVGVDERHFRRFVIIFIVHVLDEVQRVHIDGGEPFHHAAELRQHIVVVKHVRTHGRESRRDLLARLLVDAAVDGVEQALCKVGARAEELHFLARLRGGDTAADRIVVTPRGLHHVVVLVLDGTRVDGDLRRIALERFRQSLGVEHREVRLGRRTHVLERVQEAEIVLRDHGAPVHADACDFERRPDGIAREQLVVARDARELHHAELHDEVVDQFLRFSFRKPAFLHVALDVDVEEGRDAPDAHRRAVLRLDGGEVAEVEPLHGLLRRPSRTRDVEAVDRRHLLHAAKRTDLLGHFLAQADDVVGHDAVRTDFRMVGLLRLDEAVDAVERDAAVVADDAPAAIGVGQSRDDVAVACAANLRRVGVEDRLVVRLVVLREDFVQALARLVAVVPARLLRHLDAAVGHEGTLQGLVRLQTDDSFQIFE